MVFNWSSINHAEYLFCIFLSVYPCDLKRVDTAGIAFLLVAFHAVYFCFQRFPSPIQSRANRFGPKSIYRWWKKKKKEFHFSNFFHLNLKCHSIEVNAHTNMCVHRRTFSTWPIQSFSQIHTCTFARRACFVPSKSNIGVEVKPLSQCTYSGAKR